MMRSKPSILLLLSCWARASVVDDGDDTVIMLEDFSSSKYRWEEMNDPVMGGQSDGTFAIESSVGHFVGHVKNVTFLHAPGFIKAETATPAQFPDISSCQGMEYKVQSATAYSGFRVSFGKNRPPHAFPYIYGYKADLKLPKTKTNDCCDTGDHGNNNIDNSKKDGDCHCYQTVQIPFEQFTDDWDEATGDAKVTCQENPDYCPDQETLAHNLYSLVVWAEGVEGAVDLKIKHIAAYGCAASPDQTAVTSRREETKDDTTEIVLESFVDNSPTNTWNTLNDPVMGGKSHSSLAIANGVANFEGRCSIVPSLQAPGFITMQTGSFFGPKAQFPDVSSCSALKLVLRSKQPDYEGYYVSFGTVRAPGMRHGMGYKAPLTGVSAEMQEIVMPFSSFSSKWNEATGHIEVPCSEDAQYCPDTKTLENMKSMAFWGEGVEGDVSLEIESISAVGCAIPKQAFLRSTEEESNSHISFAWAGMLVGIAFVAGYLVRKTGRLSPSLRSISGLGHAGRSGYEEIELDAAVANNEN